MHRSGSTSASGTARPAENAAAVNDAARAASPRSVPSARWAPAVVAAAVLVAFAPVWNCEFVNWDDTDNFLNNTRYRGLSTTHLRWMFTTFHAGHYQPLSWLTLGLDYTLWGMQPRGYHLTNLALHLANALLVYALACALLRRTAPHPAASEARPAVAAAVAALCFAVHPLRVESVAWVTERRDVLSSLFLLLTVLAYIRMADARPRPAWRWWFGVSLGCFVLSLLSKAWGMTLPFVLLALDVYPLQRCAAQRNTVRRLLFEKLPFLVLAAATMVLAAFTVRSAGQMQTLAEHGVAARAMQAAYGLMFYLWKTILPLYLSALYPLRPDFNPAAPLHLLCALAVVVITAVVLWMRWRWPWALATWAGYVLIVSPVLGVAQSGPQVAADRYTYLACVPWALLAGAAVYRVPRRYTRAAAVVLVPMLLALTVLTFQQTRVWTNGITLWDHALRVDPTNYVANENRGWLQMHRGDLDGALAYYEAALRSNPRFADAYRSRGYVRQLRGDLQGAIADYTTSFQFDPRHAITYFNRGLARQTLGDADGALADYSVAVQVRAPNPQAYSNRALLRRQRGDLAGAIDDYEKALQVAPPEWPARAQVEADLDTLRAPAAAR
jgi:protein O-mannosyl-transferase